jgi:hypothetical protein
MASAAAEDKEKIAVSQRIRASFGRRKAHPCGYATAPNTRGSGGCIHEVFNRLGVKAFSDDVSHVQMQ